MVLQRAGRLRISKIAVGALVVAIAVDLAACNKPSQPVTPTAVAPPVQPPTPPAPPPPPPTFSAQEDADALEALKHAPDHGFAAARFPTGGIEQRLASADPSEQAQGQRQLRAEVLDYARAQHGLTIPQAALPRAWNQRPSRYDAASELDAALKGDTLQAWLDGLPPQTPAYRALQAAYVAAKAGKTGRARPRVEAGPLDLGEQDDRTRALRQRLAIADPDLADIDADAPVDQDLIDALKDYQSDRDLDDTGALDEATAARLNAPAPSRADRLRINMERLRWLPRPQPGRRIDVNIAAADLVYLRDGGQVTRMLAVAGKPTDQTPLVSSAIDSIVLNPAWHVPGDIARREIVPKGAAYMRTHHFAWHNGRLIQEAGPKAALGLVKFDFPNPYAVYLHDTPSKASFNQTQRTASHGCVRLQHAVALAKIVASEEPGLSAERVDRILASGKTVRLTLAPPIPVRLFYLTAEPKGDAIAYPDDVYGWDPVLLALLDRYSTPQRRADP